MALRRLVWLRHHGSGRRVPVEVPTVFGRSNEYYRYTGDDERPDRLRSDVVDGLAALNYIKLCSDDQVSRTHGLIDPRIPGVCDLNSTNGVWLNDRQVPARAGEAGPLVSLQKGDRVLVGRQVFEVVIAQVSEEEARAQVWTQRHAFVGSDRERRPRAAQVKKFLEERKGFKVRDAVGWPAVIANLYHLQAAAHAEGLAVAALFCDAQGEDVALDGEPMPLVKLLPLLAAVPGRKALVIEGAGDPSALERVFAGEGFEDMLLLTSPAPSREAEGESELIVPTFQSRLSHRLREDAEDTLQRELNDALDGLDALIGLDTNILQVDWAQGYDGRLKLAFGARERSDEMALSHSLRLGSSTFRF